MDGTGWPELLPFLSQAVQSGECLAAALVLLWTVVLAAAAAVGAKSMGRATVGAWTGLHRTLVACCYLHAATCMASRPCMPRAPG